MIVFDTHIWVWWVHADAQLSNANHTYLQTHEAQGLGVSIISCWEIAKLVEYNRLKLPNPVADWLDQALAYPGVRLLDLTPHIAAESTQLPSAFHHDPADQIIVATARAHNCPVMTVDTKILTYPYVQKIP